MSRQGTLQYRPPAGLLLAALLACLLFMPLNASAAEQVGRVLVATGSVTAEQADASARALGRRDAIYAGDRIRTSARGRVQIRFQDGAMVDLDPSSTFEVEEYASDDDGGGGSAVMSFLKGAMRTITGAIGANRGDEYRMNTTVATIGVRGTAYALEYCDADCAGDDGQTGLFGRVDDGEVEVDGPGGTGGFSKGQYFFVPDGGAPQRIVAPPEGILEGDGEEGTGGDDEQIEDVSIRPLDTGDEDGAGIDGDENELLNPDFESGEDTDLVGRPGAIADVLFGGGFVGGGSTGSLSESAFIASPDDGEVRLNDDGAVVGADFPGSGFLNSTNMTLEEAGVETTTIDNVDVSWGRWSGSVSVDGEDEGPADGGFVYAHTDIANLTPPAVLAANTDQTAGYNNMLNGPMAVDSSGDLWDISSLGLDVDFDGNTTNLNTFDLVRDSDSTTLDMNYNFSFGTIDDATSSLAIDNLGDQTGSYSGSLRGRFVGANGDALIVRFEVDNGSNVITGVSILEPGF